MRVAIGSDHAGYALKEAVKAYLTDEHREVLDLGTHSSDPVDYSDYAEAVGRALRENRVERGILLCGSGVGASMAANRIREYAPDCVMTLIRRTRVSSTTT